MTSGIIKGNKHGHHDTMIEDSLIWEHMRPTGQ